MYARVYNTRNQQQVLHATFFLINVCITCEKINFNWNLRKNAYIVFEMDLP